MKASSPTEQPASELPLPGVRTELPFAWSLAAAAVLVLVLAATEVGAGLYRQMIRARASAQAVDFAARLRARVDTELNSIIYLSSGLSAYFTVNADSLDDTEIRRMLKLLYRDSRYTRNFGVAVGYILTYVYPETGNKAAIGLDYRKLPDQFGAVQAAIAQRRPTLSPRVDLVQGGQGVIYRCPIFVDGEYWGLLSTVIDINALLGAAFHGLADGKARFAVREAGPDGAVLWGDAALFSDLANPRLISDEGWEYVARPVEDRRETHALYILRGLGYLFAVSLALTAYLALRHRRDLLRLSREDALTGLPNRRVLDERIRFGLRHLRRSDTAGFTLVFVDLDDFKQINDTFGHRAGDAVLKAVAGRLYHQFRATDLVARWGGDEFAAYVEETRPPQLRQLQERLLELFEQPVMFHGSPILVRGSVGFATAPVDGSTEDSLVAAADRRMYRQKAGAENRA